MTEYLTSSQDETLSKYQNLSMPWLSTPGDADVMMIQTRGVRYLSYLEISILS